METQKSPRLTRMQLTVLRLVTQGKTNKQVADELFVTRRTVDYHLQIVYQKLEVSNRVQAFIRARDLGLV